MSLIHEALARAREEAARRQALARGEAPAPAPPPDHYRFRTPLWVAAGLAVAVLLGGIALGLRLASSREEAARTAAVSSREGTEELAAGPVARLDPTVPRRQTRADAVPPATSDAVEPPRPSAGAGDAHSLAGAASPVPRESPVDEPAHRSAALEGTGSAPAPSRDAASSLPESSTDGVASSEGAVPAHLAARAGRRTDPQPASGARADLGGGRSLELQGVVWNTVSPSAVINGILVEPGDEVEGCELLRIEPRTTVLSDGEREIVLRLGPEGG